MKQTKIEYEQEFVKCILTAEEKTDLSELIARKTLEQDDIEKEKKSAMSGFKDRLERVQVDMRSCATKLKDGYEMRNVDCAVNRDYEVGIVRYVRTDTGETARTRDITPSERQLHFDDLEYAKKKTETKEVSEEVSEEEIQHNIQQQKTNRMMVEEKSVGQ